MFITFVYITGLIGLTVSCYKDIFNVDYQRAVEYNFKNKKLYINYAKKYNLDANELKTIVFPELIRYSYFKDLMETKALEQLYVQGGSKSADFSIGHFQMKPSFVEELEASVSSNSLLKIKYACVVNYNSGSKIFAERIERLKNEEWQFIYLCCFVDICLIKFPTLNKIDKEERIKFLCTAYNSGYNHNEEKILSLSKEKYFPYGPRFKAQQYAYADVALDYYNNYLNK